MLPIKLLKRWSVSKFYLNQGFIFHFSSINVQHDKKVGFKSFTSSTKYNCSHIIPYKLSDIGEGIKEVAIKEWFVKVGDDVKQFDNICEVQSDKASVTITSRFDGKIMKLHKDIDEIIQVGNPLVDIQLINARENSKNLGPSSDYNTPREIKENKEPLKTSKPNGLAIPMVRKLAKDLGVLDIGVINSTRPDGRVTEEDVRRYVASNSPSHRVEKVKGIRKAMIKTMRETLKIPQFSFTEEVDVRKLLKMRERLGEAILSGSEKGSTPSKLTLTPFFIKSVSMALEKFPILNSRFNESEETVEYLAYHNVGIAMDSTRGLLVPNVKGVQRKTLREITQELNNLTALCRADRLGPDDLSRGTFTISNIGTIGGTHAQSIILPPEVAIAALARIRKLPRFEKEGERDQHVTPCHVMNICVTADHRVVDGATVARFVTCWKRLLEHPENMIVDLR